MQAKTTTTARGNFYGDIPSENEILYKTPRRNRVNSTSNAAYGSIQSSISIQNTYHLNPLKRFFQPSMVTEAYEPSFLVTTVHQSFLPVNWEKNVPFLQLCKVNEAYAYTSISY